ncbi:hypothetical protein JDS92_23850 [Bacillus cereus group sp. N12]|uniref:hypothetical protein n=1 Tax=Bacillus cereus group sp. N12 TaxID=2794586 RepID=UPI0018F52AF5|nr:hypothetical protein [Bacillus cereus group sp. N12]MBJ8078369.1 hypothetical protein [Bacillus cereus group sp. N12]
MVLNKKIIFPSSILLVICHIFIAYYWVVDWKKLTTPYGLIIWISSTLFGFLLYRYYKKLSLKLNKKFNFGALLLIISSSFMVLLGIVFIVIAITVNSMP